MHETTRTIKVVQRHREKKQYSVGSVLESKQQGIFGGSYPYFQVPYVENGKHKCKKFYFVLGDDKSRAEKQALASSFQLQKQHEFAALTK